MSLYRRCCAACGVCIAPHQSVAGTRPISCTEVIMVTLPVTIATLLVTIATLLVTIVTEETRFKYDNKPGQYLVLRRHTLNMIINPANILY